MLNGISIEIILNDVRYVNYVVITLRHVILTFFIIKDPQKFVRF